ncbi:MAG: L-histidine N(alpha)-methyltransferase [Gemmatimonadetes bacterium]|nr:L-histidine N(alpha)-methyltransferase [Gemmatimonadota bacterium]
MSEEQRALESSEFEVQSSTSESEHFELCTANVELSLAEIRDGLSRPQKELPPKYFYDERGSRLFEEITELPEYYLTRAERALLEEWMPRWVGDMRPRAVVELGAGSGRKTRIILDAMVAGVGKLYVPVDISEDFLESTAVALRGEYDGMDVWPLVADIGGVLDLPRDLPDPVLFAFLGSTIGNFTPEAAIELLAQVRAAMSAGDRFLLGVDLRKDPGVIEAAYNDSRGVTAEFNLNMLRVLNAEFGANFDPAAFRHHAFYHPERHCVEMHLVSANDQSVSVPGAGDFRLAAGESIRTEISCKQDRASVEWILAGAGMGIAEWATDDEGRYALVLATAERGR